MYKVIVADDEKIILEGLSNFVDWAKLGFEIVATFNDAESAIEYLDNIPVDVVLTDIKMGYRGGLDIAKHIQDEKISCKVVLISGHKEFDLLLQGMKYGVEDYILKPSTVEEVETVFTKLKKSLDERNSDIERIREIEDRWREVRPILEDTFFSNLIMGAIEDPQYITQRLAMLYPDLDVEKAACFLAILEIQEYEDYIENKWQQSAEQFRNAISKYIKEYQSDCIYNMVYKAQGKIKLFAVMKEAAGEYEKDISSFQRQIDQFCDDFANIFGFTTTVSIDQHYGSIFKLLRHEGSIITNQSSLENIEIHIREQKKLIISNIMEDNIGTAQRIMQNMVSSLSRETTRYRNDCLVDLWVSISNFLRENNKAEYERIQPYINHMHIFSLKSETEILTYCNRIFDKIKVDRHDSEQFDRVALIKRVEEYVQEHIFEDIVAEDIANTLFISTAHLRRLIKQQTGETSLRFITKIKMEKAMELLHNPEYKAYQIGSKLGYKTPRYFSKLFYDYTGFYPSQYRKEVLGMRGVEDDE